MIQAIVDVDGRPSILTLANHTPWYASEVALIDPTDGGTMDAYYHPGNLYSTAVADIDLDGTVELLLGGVNNPGAGLGHPMVVVLDIPFSAVDSGGHLDYFGNPGPRELSYVVFPRPIIYDLIDDRPKVFTSRLKVKPDGTVRAGVFAGTRGLYYELDFSDLAAVQVEDTSPEDSFVGLHKSMGRPMDLDRLETVLNFESAPDGNSRDLRVRFGGETRQLAAAE